jgi:hypothetical protein
MVFRSSLNTVAALVCFFVFLSESAFAELGGSLPTVEADRSRMAAQILSRDMGTYTRHTLTRPNGGSVRELTNAAGQVFAVIWSGPGKPDLRSLLGSRFAPFQAANSRNGHTMRSLRRSPRVDQPDLKIMTEGHMGWFRGAAFIPSLAPTGFSASDLSQEL